MLRIPMFQHLHDLHKKNPTYQKHSLANIKKTNFSDGTISWPNSMTCPHKLAKT